MSPWAAQRFLGELKRIQQGLLGEVFAERNYLALMRARRIVAVVLLLLAMVATAALRWGGAGGGEVGVMSGGFKRHPAPATSPASPASPPASEPQGHGSDGKESLPPE